jgi:thiosulfate dehydrogenase
MPTSRPVTFCRSAALISILALPFLAFFAVRGAVAQEQDIDEYSNKGFYQSYIFGRPDSPSESWMLAYGGRLYDMWWGVLFQEPPETTHPAYPESGQQSGAMTWRCVECHGWDYRGKDGAYAAGPHATGIKGVDGMAGAEPAAIAKIIRGPAHGYTPEMVPDEALAALALFVSKGVFSMAPFIDTDSRAVRGDRERGRHVYQNVCAICHDFDGLAWIAGEEEGLNSLAATSQANPWRAMHKIMNGQTYADMPALRVFGPEVVRDVLSYTQTLPHE